MVPLAPATIVEATEIVAGRLSVMTLLAEPTLTYSRPCESNTKVRVTCPPLPGMPLTTTCGSALAMCWPALYAQRYTVDELDAYRNDSSGANARPWFKFDAVPKRARGDEQHREDAGDTC